jgi:hypothetical protein
VRSPSELAVDRADDDQALQVTDLNWQLPDDMTDGALKAKLFSDAGRSGVTGVWSSPTGQAGEHGVTGLRTRPGAGFRDPGICAVHRWRRYDRLARVLPECTCWPRRDRMVISQSPTAALFLIAEEKFWQYAFLETKTVVSCPLFAPTS